MIVSDRHKYLFIEIPRTGTTSMSYVLRKQADGVRVKGEKHIRDIPQEAKDYKVFACVRNPYDRMYSHYCYRRARCLNRGKKLETKLRTFADYVDYHVSGEEDHQNSNTQLWYLRYAANPLIVKFEDLPKSFLNLPFLPKNIKLPYTNSASKGKWQDQYTEELAEMVFSWAHQDFEQFEYNKESWRDQTVERQRVQRRQDRRFQRRKIRRDQNASAFSDTAE